MKVLITLVAGLALATPAFATNRCSLAKAMHNLGVPKDELAFWTCVAENEISSRTEVADSANSDSSNDYGNFQVNNYYKCQSSNGHNDCKLTCDALLSDDIIGSVVCARKVLGQQGWSARETWKYCDDNSNSIDNCF